MACLNPPWDKKTTLIEIISIDLGGTVKSNIEGRR
jgi:hypothetical protein